MPTLPAVLTRELGQGAVGLDGTTTDPYESTPELAYPANLAVIDRMRKTDPGVRAVMRAVKNPILGTPWRLNPTGCRPVVVAHVANELGLVRDSHGRYRSRPGGIRWIEFLQHVLLHLDYGHMPFEEVYEVGPWDLPGLAGVSGLPPAVHLRLEPRMPRTLDGFDVDTSGRLRAIFQQVEVNRVRKRVPIPAEKLTYFTNEREGADWAGQSVHRAAYKHWMLKDALLRISAISADRTGSGVPVVTYPKNGSPGDRATALGIARSVRAGEDAGLALEEGWTLALLGVEGSVLDPLPLIKYHGQETSKSALAMFLDLGHDAGARSLGETFLDVFLLAEGAVVRYLEDTITGGPIRNLVRHTFSPNEPWPSLTADPISADSIDLAGLAQLAQQGLLGPLDDGLTGVIRRRAGLPQAPAELPGAPQTGGVDDPLSVVDGDVVPTQRTGGAAPVVLPPGSPGSTARTGVPARPTPAIGGAPAVRQPAVAAAAGVTYEAETEQIRARRDTEGAAPHPFAPAQWTFPNGHPRCRLCGCEERTGGCLGARRDGGRTSSPGSRGVVTFADPGAPALEVGGGLSDLVGTLARVTDTVHALAAAQGVPVP